MKKFRPFWSYRIDETEQWLSEMAQDGYQLKAFYPILRLFTFEQKPSHNTRYLIDYQAPNDLYEQGGWYKISQKGQWSIFVSDNPTRFSTRDTLFQRIRLHYMAMTAFLVLFFFFVSTTLGIYTAFRFEAFNTTFYLLTSGMLLALFLGATISLGKWYHAKELHYLNVSQKVGDSAIKKRRPGWMYVQFLTKRWLDRMFLQGYELTHVKGMTFYFQPRQAANISYEIINEKPKNNAVLAFYKDSGWSLKNVVSSPLWHISIWAKAYDLHEVKPQLSYIKEERLSSLRRGLRNTAGLSVLFIALMGLNIFNSINQIEGNYLPNVYVIPLLGLSTIALLFWLWVFAQSIYGYMQEKRQL